MSEFWSSFSKWFEEKANSPLYWTYLGFFVAWNWRFFQIIFFEDSSLFTTPRIEYLDTLLFTPFGIAVLDWVANLVWHIIPPAIFTYIAVKYLPRLHKWALQYYLEGRFERKKVLEAKKDKHEEWALQNEERRIKRYEKFASLQERQKEAQRNMRQVETQKGTKDEKLTDSQIESILALLSSFGAKQETINDVENALRG